MKQIDSYSELCPLLRSGDLIAFSDDNFVSQFLIKPFTNSIISHVGIVLKGYRTIDGTPTKDERAYCLESHPLDFNRKGIISKLKHGGVIIVPLKKRLKLVKKTAFFFKLNRDIKKIKYDYKGKKCNGEEWIWKWYDDNKHKEYEYTFPFNMYSTTLDTELFFCSEMIALIYKKLGIIPEIVEENKVVPGSFGVWKEKMDKGMEIFSNDFKYDKEVLKINNWSVSCLGYTQSCY